MPVEEPALVKEEEIMQQNQIMQHPSGSEDWLPTEDVVPQQMSKPRRHSPTPVRRTSISSARIKHNDNLDATIAASAEAANATPRRAMSINRAGSSYRKSVPTTAEARPMPGSTFLGGAGAIGPKATAEEDTAMTARNQEAQVSLTPKQKSKIAKTEGKMSCTQTKFPFCLIVLRFPRTAKHNKRLSKIIKGEGKAEKNALAIAIDELDSLQKIQKGTIKVCQSTFDNNLWMHVYLLPFPGRTSLKCRLISLDSMLRSRGLKPTFSMQSTDTTLLKLL
jgi:hypothetical protein